MPRKTPKRDAQPLTRSIRNSRRILQSALLRQFRASLTLEQQQILAAFGGSNTDAERPLRVLVTILGDVLASILEP